MKSIQLSRSAFNASAVLALLGLSMAALGCGASQGEPGDEEETGAAEQAVQTAVCNLRITTNLRPIDANQSQRGFAAAHGGYIDNPQIVPSAPGTHCYGATANMIRTMQDGEGWCAYNGETLSSVDVVACPAAPELPVCNLVITTSQRVINVNSAWLGGAADHDGYTGSPGLVDSEPGSRCARDGWSKRIQTMNDGEGFCAYNGETIEDVEVVRCSSPPLHPVCDLKITTTASRTVDVNDLVPGGVAEHGEYVYDPALIANVADASHDCTKAGYGAHFGTFADGEGFCAYDHESIVSVERTLCPFPQPQNLVITTDRRTINVNQLVPGGAAAHNGLLVTPSIQDSLPRCHHLPEYDYDKMIVVFGDGEGFCAYEGETILSVYREVAP